MQASPRQQRNNTRIALVLAGVVVGMVGVSFASVPTCFAGLPASAVRHRLPTRNRRKFSGAR